MKKRAKRYKQNAKKELWCDSNYNEKREANILCSFKQQCM